MTGEKSASTQNIVISRKQVVQYLRDHPDLFKESPELLEIMTPPEVQHGGNVVDWQHHMLGKLQTGMKSLKNKYEGLLLSSRDNMSTLHQVHQAALSLIRAPQFEQLLEVISMDLPALFNVDVVRLALESEAAEFYERHLGQDRENTAIVFLERGAVAKVMGKEKATLLVSDTARQFVFGFEQIFPEYSGIVESCAFLRMRLPSSQRDALLAFGVRIKDHFHEGQGTELLTFLSQIVEHRLDQCLENSGLGNVL